MEKELTAAVTTQEPMLADSLIVVQQLPVIKEQLHSIKAQAQASVAEALALVCTEETLKVVKEQRAKLNRDRKDLDDRRAVVKKQIMKPFEDFDKVYKECVTDVYGPADEALKGKITDVEAGLKADKEKKVVAYFDELVKANGVEWVSYEDIGIAVTMTASLKSLKSKVKEYVDRVVADVNCINGMENAPEVMAEYKQCRNLAVAINSVSQRKDRVAREEAERKQRLEAQLRAQEAESAVLDAVEEELAAFPAASFHVWRHASRFPGTRSPTGKSESALAQFPAPATARTNTRFLRWGTRCHWASSTLHATVLFGPATTPLLGCFLPPPGGMTGASAPQRAPKKHPNALSGVERTPGTFSHSTHLGLKWSAMRQKVRHRFPRSSARLPRFPATLNAWQGVPPTKRLIAGMFHSWYLVISPRLGTSGNRSASTADGKGSISEKATGSHPRDSHATEAASMPEQTERYFMRASFPVSPPARQ